MKRKMKRLVAMVLALAMAGTLTACGEKGDSSSGDSDELAKELNIYIWSEYIPDSVIEGFEKEYGIDVNVTFFTSSDELLSKVMTGGASEYDLVQPSLNHIEALREGDYIQKLNYDNIPNYEYVEESFKNQYFAEDDAEYCVPYMAGTTVIAYNKNTCPVEIKELDDLLDPALEGQIVSITSSQTVMAMVLAHLGYDPNSTEEEEIAEAGAWLKELKPNIKVFDGDAPRKSLLNGECSVAIIYGGDMAIAMNEQPDTFEVCQFSNEDFKYGIGATQFCVTKDAAHAKEAEMFINWIHEPENYAACLDAYPYISSNTEAENYVGDAYKNITVYDFSEEQLENAYQTRDLGDASIIWDKYWSEFMNQ